MSLRYDLRLHAVSPSKCETREQEPVKKCRRLTPTHHISMFVRRSAKKCTRGESSFTASPSRPRSSELVISALLSLRLRQDSASAATDSPRVRSHLADSPAPPRPRRNQTQPHTTDTHRRNVTFNGECHQSHAYMQQSPTQGAVLRV